MEPWRGNSADAAVDVYITTHNHDKFIGECLDSVTNQRFRHKFNIYIYDDHSSKRNVFWKFKDAGFDVELGRVNLGVSKVRNHCYQTKGCAPLVLFVDGDDKLDVDFLEKAWRRMQIGKADVVYPKAAIFTDSGMSPHGHIPQSDYDKMSLFRSNYIPVTALMKREDLAGVGGFDEDMNIGYQDWELWIRLAILEKSFIFEREAILYYRHHAGSMSHDANKRLDEVTTYIYNKHYDLYYNILKPKIFRVGEDDEIISEELVLLPA